MPFAAKVSTNQIIQRLQKVRRWCLISSNAFLMSRLGYHQIADEFWAFVASPRGRNCPNCILILGKSQDWRCFSSQSSNSQCLCFFTCINPIPEEPQTLKLAVFSLRTCFVIVFPPKMWLETYQNLAMTRKSWWQWWRGRAEICVFRWTDHV